ncbi:hypothetical protein MYOV003v1_p0051 [Vibrio phage 207E48.1]|nr:hypothetical protein MYOV003v1_p0051 [Vibrio phage 207E48.1]
MNPTPRASFAKLEFYVGGVKVSGSDVISSYSHPQADTDLTTNMSSIITGNSGDDVEVRATKGDGSISVRSNTDGRTRMAAVKIS